jgi:hypothetical protein
MNSYERIYDLLTEESLAQQTSPKSKKKRSKAIVSLLRKRAEHVGEKTGRKEKKMNSYDRIYNILIESMTLKQKILAGVVAGASVFGATEAHKKIKKERGKYIRQELPISTENPEVSTDVVKKAPKERMFK